MLTSTQLSIDMLDRADRFPVPGLPNAIYNEKSEATGADTIHRRALALATRIAQISNLTQMPLPKAILLDMPTDATIADGAGSPLLEANRTVQVPVRASSGDLAVSAITAKSLTIFSSATRGPRDKGILEALAAKAHASPSENIAVNKASPSTLGSQTHSPGLPGPLTPPNVMAAMVTKRTNGIVAQRRDDGLLPLKLVDERLPAWASTSMRETRLPAAISLMSKMPEVLADTMLRDPGRRSLEIKQNARSAAIDGIANVLKSPQTSRLGNRSAGNAGGPGLLLASLPGRGLPGPVSGLAAPSDSQSDIRQRAVPTMPARTRFRTRGQGVVPRTLTAPASAPAIHEENSDSDARSLAPSHAINITGALTVDSRRLGRLTASSQAREASLPASGPSRVNLRAVPIFSGMKIPS